MFHRYQMRIFQWINGVTSVIPQTAWRSAVVMTCLPTAVLPWLWKRSRNSSAGLQRHHSSPARDEKETHSLPSSLADTVSLILKYFCIGHLSNLKTSLHSAVKRLHRTSSRTPLVTSLFKYFWTRSLVVNGNTQNETKAKQSKNQNPSQNPNNFI